MSNQALNLAISGAAFAIAFCCYAWLVIVYRRRR